MSNKAAQTTWMTAVGVIPADSSIVIADPLVAAYARIAATGTVVPVSRLFEAFWVPFTSAAVKVVMEGADATTEVRTACSAMNATNGR
jgi:maltose-binding protein MalE